MVSAPVTSLRLETYLARTARRLAVPSGAKSEKNPFTASPELMAEARAHFADHCAVCHANNEYGDRTESVSESSRHAAGADPESDRWGTLLHHSQRHTAHLNACMGHGRERR